MSDLILLMPELVLVMAALALVVVARHVTRPAVAAICVVIAAAGALASAWVFPGGVGGGFGGAITGDGYARFFTILFTSTAALAAMLSVRAIETEHVPPAEYYALLLLATAGMMLAAAALDLVILYLGLELMTLCAYILVGITRERLASNEAAIKYFLLGSFASAVLLYGIALIYGVTGETDFAGIASAAAVGGRPSAVLLVGIALVAGGLAFKIAAVPLHAWAPDVYQGASAPVAGFLAAGSKAAGLAALVRICLVAFPSEHRMWSEVLVTLAALSMVVGSLLAIAQTNMKRLLAYSSIAHAGYALIGLVPGTPEGASATMTYAFVYAFMTLGTFGVVIALGERGETLDGYRGLDDTAPRTAGVMFLFLLSMTGIPLTAGFTAKFAVILSAVRAGYVPLALLAVACSVVSAFFYLRVAVLMFMTSSERAAPARFPAAVSAAIILAALVIIAGGVFPDAFSRWTVPPLGPGTTQVLRHE